MPDPINTPPPFARRDYEDDDGRDEQGFRTDVRFDEPREPTRAPREPSPAPLPGPLLIGESGGCGECD